MYLDSISRIFKEQPNRQNLSVPVKDWKPALNSLSARLQSFRFGGAREDRTPDLLRAKQALSQLSYGPELFGGSGKI